MEATRLSSDMISNLPAPVIESILCLVPIQEAARTSISSRDWRYHWTNIPKLVFIQDAVKVSSNDDYDELLISRANRKLFNAINQVMSMHQGPINEFSLSTHVDGRCVEIDQIINYLSRNNNVMKLTLDMSGYWLPESLFSLHKLRELYLHHCRLDVQPTFSGFRSLANLFMENVIITKKMLLLFLNSCPLLKTVTLSPVLGSSSDIDDFNVIELFKFLPVVEVLSIRLSMMPYFDEGRVPKKLPAALVHLKYLCLRDTRDVYRYRIPFYAFLIRSSPNLEKLKLKIIYDISLGVYAIRDRDRYSDLWLEHLKEFEIDILITRYSKLEFLKLILAKSPVLKNVKIRLRNKISKNEELKIIGNFLRCPRVSQVVEIIVESGVKFDRMPFNRVL